CLGAPSGEELYKVRCASCHDQSLARVPPREALQTLSAGRILRTLDFGLMMNIAYTLKRDEREAIANFLGTSESDVPAIRNACPAGNRAMAGSSTGNWNGWGPSPDNARYQPTEKAGVTLDQVRKLKLKWVFAFPGDMTAFGASTVLNGTLF